MNERDGYMEAIIKNRLWGKIIYNRDNKSGTYGTIVTSRRGERTNVNSRKFFKNEYKIWTDTQKQ